MVAYPHPVIRMPVICRQCGEPKCRDNCPTGAIARVGGIVEVDEEKCVSCQQCVMSCPFGSMFTHEDMETPFKCDLCGGTPQCVKECPNHAILYRPPHLIGESHRMASLLKYAHMKEVEYVEKGERRILHYAEIERDKEDAAKRHQEENEV
jgi:carbon-monoxide dehydrogenase iron sulfur subunit